MLYLFGLSRFRTENRKSTFPGTALGRGLCAHTVAIDHPDIAGIDGQRQALAHHQCPGLLMHGIGQAEQGADQAAIPEGDRNDAMAFLFAAEPLNQKPHAENRLAAEADGIPRHVIRMIGGGGIEMREVSIEHLKAPRLWCARRDAAAASARPACRARCPGCGPDWCIWDAPS